MLSALGQGSGNYSVKGIIGRGHGNAGENSLWCSEVWLETVEQAGSNWFAISSLQESLRHGDFFLLFSICTFSQ